MCIRQMFNSCFASNSKAQPIQSRPTTDQQNVMKKQGQQQQEQEERRCHLCYVTHTPFKCRAKFWICYHCGQKGHSYHVCNVR
jgi:hypothetical protein